MFVEHKEPGEVKVLDEESKLLPKAADLIEQHGWCQNDYQSLGGQLCILGAIKTALGFGPRGITRTNNVAEMACKRVHDSTGMHVAEWNDQPARTQSEVVAKLRSVALGG